MNGLTTYILKQNQSFLAIYVFPQLLKYGIGGPAMIKELTNEYGIYYSVENFIEFGNKNLNKKLEAHSITFEQLLELSIQPIVPRFVHLLTNNTQSD